MPVRGRANVFDVLNVVVIGLVGVIVVYPFLYTVSVSLSDSFEVLRGSVTWYPRGFNLGSYEAVFTSPRIWRAYANTILYTSVGTLVRVAMLMMTAYPLSRRRFVFRRAFTFLILFTMLFGGGIIPYYLVVRALGMLNTLWAMVIPGALGAYSIVVVRTYFQATIHPSLIEAAEMDGANDAHTLFRIVLPLSTPIVAVMCLFTAVGIWNDYFTPLLFFADQRQYPLTIILREVLISATGDEFKLYADAKLKRPPQTIQSATLMVSTVPILLFYPFLQRYFVKGIMVGSIRE